MGKPRRPMTVRRGPRSERTELRFPAEPGSELAQLRNEAHRAFDVHWEFAGDDWKSRNRARTQAYRWLSKQLRIPFDQCHFGMFGKEECRRAIELCRSSGPQV